MGWPGPMTNRQYLVVSRWLDEEWNRPSRTDNYLMLIAHEVRQVLATKPRPFDNRKMRIPFETAAIRALTPAEKAERVRRVVEEKRLRFAQLSAPPPGAARDRRGNGQRNGS